MSSTATVELRKVLAIAVVLVVAFLVGFEYLRVVEPAAAREVKAACKGLRPSPTNPALGKLPAPAPDFALGSEPDDFLARDLNGEPVQLSDFRGKVVFVNFWASWCNVCKAEKGGLVAMTSKLAGDDMVVLTVASDTSWDKVVPAAIPVWIRAMLSDGPAPRILLDPPPNEDSNLGRTALGYGIKAVPESFVVDRNGVVQHYFINKRDWSSGITETCLRDTLDG